MTIEDASNKLAALLRTEDWYHRTSFVWEQGIGNYLTVWGEFDRPESLPTEYEGFPVRFNRVSARHPCPFGSVKPKRKGRA